MVFIVDRVSAQYNFHAIVLLPVKAVSNISACSGFQPIRE